MKKGKNMSKMKTYVAVVLDSSGSMASTKRQTVLGFNEQIQQAKANAKDQKDIGEYKACIVTFNGEVFEHQWLVPVEELQEASDEDYQPSGATAMRDAVGYTIQKLLDTTNPDEPGVAYFIYVVSDGEENQSKHYSISGLRELVQSVEKRPNFTITYMGCSPKYLKEVAESTGIPLANMAAWSNATPEQARGGWHHSNKATDKLYKARARGVVKLECLQSADAAVCADYSDEVADADLMAAPVGAATMNAGAPAGVMNAVVGATADVAAQAYDNLPKSNIFGNRTPVQTWNVQK
jgi:uncharacterized protein YegL